MGDGSGPGEVVDEGFLRRYRELLDAEEAAFDELEHSYEEGDRPRYEQDLARWRSVVERKAVFLDRSGLVPVTSRA
jgi:cytoskeletal protein RodZ